MFSLDQNDLPYDILLSLLMTMKYSVENYLKMIEYWKVCNIISEDIPAAIFWVNRDGSLRYANDRARLRMDEGARMEDVFLNYEHIPVQKGFDGKKTIRKEITWITQDRTYEDVTSILPVYNSGRVDSVVVITMSIEDLKTTIAHATGYSSRYSLYSMVGNSSEFQALQHKAARVARGDNNILLQGEPGTGKQRLAHGIHQASPRAAAPLITVRGHEGPEEELEEEFLARPMVRAIWQPAVWNWPMGERFSLMKWKNSRRSWAMSWLML